MNINGLGTFSSIPSQDPNAQFPTIQFTHKPLVANDEELLKFIVTETGKMRPLAESDLESFVTSGQQLLNIGKPFFIEGLGALQRNQNGVWDFITGDQISEKASYDIEEERKLRGDLHEVPQRKIIDTTGHDGYQNQSNGLNWKRIILSVVGLVVLLGGGFALYKFVLKPNAEEQAVSRYTDAQKDTIKNRIDSATLAKKDSLTPKPVNTMVVNTDGTIKYNIVFKTLANKAEADKYLSKDIKFDSIKIQVAPLDAIKYKAFIPIKSTVADSGAIRKRVIKFLLADSNTVYIEK